MRAPLLTPVALALFCSISPSAFGADEKPDIEVKTRAAEITVTIEQDLKAYPGVADDLLAEGRRYVAKARAEAEKEYRTNRVWFKDGDRRWSYDLVYSYRSLVTDRYLSILRDNGTFTGGAHPNSRTDTILWDADEKKRINIRRFFRETNDGGPTMTALANLVRRAVAVEKLDRWKQAAPDDEKNKPQPTPNEMVATDPDIRRGIQPKLLKIGPISLAPSTVAYKSSGLTFHFSPYDVDAYAAGPYTVFVPWTELKPFLSADGEKIFGGERPEKDKEQP